MTPLRVGVIGASRRQNGTGEFVARFFAEAGAEVAAVAGTSQATAAEAAARLRRSDGAVPYPAGSAAEMIERCALDAVAICSPSHCHAEHLALALDAGLHVFCEKPLVWQDRTRMLPQSRQLIERFTARERVVHLNTQWIYTLPAFRELHPLSDRPRAFSMDMAPPVRGLAMLPEALPHPISLLVALGATGPVSDVQGQWSPARDALALRFTAAAADAEIDVSCRLRQVTTQPRDAAYAIDGCRVDREVDLPTYALRLRANGRSVELPDPVRLSVQRFLDRVRNNDYHGQAASLCANVQMLDELAAALSGALEDGDGGRNP